MVNPPYLAKIENHLQSCYPGYVAVIDIAALKIKNSLLGHMAGDREIEDLENIIQKHIDRPEFAIRIGGDEWLLFFPSNPIKQLKNIANDYSAKEVKVTIGWQCKATKKYCHPQQAEATKQSILYRGIKICYLAIDNAEELAEKSAIALNNSSFSYSYCPVNTPIETPTEITELKQQAWCSIDLALLQQYCPYCRHTEFDWQDWSGDMFGEEGNCKNCQAEVVFSTIFQPEN